MAWALDWYLKLDDVHGDAAEDHHLTWIETYSWKLRKADPPWLVAVIVAGSASARLASAMKTQHRFMRAQLHGVMNRNTREVVEYVDLRVIEIVPGGNHRSGPLSQVTFQYNVR
jgi:hypothetical protein